MVPADSRRISRAPRYSGYRYAACRFGYGTITLCGPSFQKALLSAWRAMTRSYNPAHARRTRTVWALPRSLAATGGIIKLFSLPGGTKMFQFPPLASAKYGWVSFRYPGCPIRRPADQGSFAPTRGLSQLITSFIAWMSLGIRHTPLFTFFFDLCLSP